MAEKLRSRHSLAIANKSLPDGKLIRIRSYSPSDSEQVRQLFKASVIHGPQQTALNTQWRRLTAYVSYCTLVLGFLLATFQTSPRIRYIGIAFCIASCALFVALRYTLSYRFSGFERRLGRHRQNLRDEARYEIGNSKTEIIGSIGLDANKNSDKTNAELCRMVVSRGYRRRGIARSLVKTTLLHAQNHGVTSVVLSTGMFRPAAIAMYEKFGWVLQKEVGVKIMLDTVWVFYSSLDLTTVKV